MVKRTTRLQGSKQKRDDEYYTLFQDIADEVSLYLPQLRGKRICVHVIGMKVTMKKSFIRKKVMCLDVTYLLQKEQ